MTFKVTLKVTEVYLGLLSSTLVHMHRTSGNSEKSVAKCREVLFLAFLIDLADFIEIFAIYRAGSRAKCPYLMS